MADRYWVGGTASWDGTAGTKWATTSGGAGGAAVPTSADDVFFDAASGANTVTIATGNTGAKSITCTGFTGTLAGSASMSVAGSVTLVAGMSVTYTGIFTITATGTFTSGGKTLQSVTIDATGGTVTLGSDINLTSSLTVTRGTFTTSASNYAISAISIASNNSNTRVITLNASTITLTANGTAISCATSSGLTFDAGTSSITLTGTNGSISTGGVTFYNVSFTSTSVGAISISGANTFNNLTLTAPASAGVTIISFGANQTITTLVASGASATRRIRFRSNASASQRTLTVTTWTTRAHMDFQDIAFDTSRSATTADTFGDMGRNTNITFGAAKTVYWNLSGSQNWSTNGWATSSGGSPAATNFPLAQDTAVFDNTGSAGTVTVQSSWAVGTIDMSSRTTAMTLTGLGNANLYITGNLTFGTGVTQSGFIGFYFTGVAAQTINTNGVSLGGSIYVEGASLSLGSNLSCNVFNIISSPATFTANTYDINIASFSSIASTTTNMGSGTWTISATSGTPWSVSSSASCVLNAQTANIVLSSTATSARTFSGGNKTYNKLTIGGATGTSTLTITGSNTFTEIASTKTVAHTILFNAGTTFTVGNFTVDGTSGNVVTLGSNAASPATLVKTGGGFIAVDYASISNLTASPSSTWYATNSTDGGGNSGWIFGAPPVGNGLLFGSNF